VLPKGNLERCLTYAQPRPRLPRPVAVFDGWGSRMGGSPGERCKVSQVVNKPRQHSYRCGEPNRHGCGVTCS